MSSLNIKEIKLSNLDWKVFLLSYGEQDEDWDLKDKAGERKTKTHDKEEDRNPR